MSNFTLEDNIVFMQINIAIQLMEKWSVTPSQFVELDLRYGVLDYIRLYYEPFHLTGDIGIIEEIEIYIERQGGMSNGLMGG